MVQRPDKLGATQVPPAAAFPMLQLVVFQPEKCSGFVASGFNISLNFRRENVEGTSCRKAETAREKV
jgi:hypothetical protein